MITTYKQDYEDGELRIGWASWDKGLFKERSIKYAYRNSGGKISRGAPEIPFNTLVDMVILAYQRGELSSIEITKIRDAFATSEIKKQAG